MVYYSDFTDFELTAAQYTPDTLLFKMPHIDDNVSAQILAELSKKTDVFSKCYNTNLSFGVTGSAKWINWERDMLSISSDYPGILFKLDGNGDAEDDVWTAYFFEGKVQLCPIIWLQDDFDPEKLTTKS